MTTTRIPAKQLWLFGALTWTVLGLLSAAQNAAWRTLSGRPVPWLFIIPNSLADWYTCGIFTPLFYWMVRRFPIRGERWWTRLPVHLLAATLVVFAKVTLYAPLYHLLNPTEPRTYQQILFGGFYYDFLAYWAAIGVIHAIEYYWQTARLDAALRAAELENLRAQLQPHFLFNTLQSISTLIHRDQAAADRMLTDLSDLLRLSLGHSGKQLVALRDELDFLNRYLDIMRVRFGDRLAITVDAPAELLDASVPALVLQPIVENAIRHGMADRTDVGHVNVSARRENGGLVLEVVDDGNGSGAGNGHGVGLANTRERLERLYGNAGKVIATSRAAGFSVRLEIPCAR